MGIHGSSKAKPAAGIGSFGEPGHLVELGELKELVELKYAYELAHGCQHAFCVFSRSQRQHHQCRTDWFWWMNSHTARGCQWAQGSL